MYAISLPTITTCSIAICYSVHQANKASLKLFFWAQNELIHVKDLVQCLNEKKKQKYGANIIMHNFDISFLLVRNSMISLHE